MKELKDFLEDLEEFTYEEIEGLYEEMLDEVYEPVELAGMTIYASDMKSIDPVMFRCGVADWSSEEFEEYEDKYYRKEEFENAQQEYDDYLEENEEE